MRVQGANRLQGVHTWNLAGSSGGTGILLHGGSGRVQDAYLDYAPLVIRAPTDVQVSCCRTPLCYVHSAFSRR
jgi:hypothetical protein